MMTRSRPSQAYEIGTAGSQRPPAAATFEQTAALLEGTVLLRVADSGDYPVLIAGKRFAACFPQARPNGSFLALFGAESRGRALAALHSVAARGEAATLSCVRRSAAGVPQWLEIALEPMMLAPGAPGRVLARLMTAETGDPSRVAEVLAAARHLTPGGRPAGAPTPARLRPSLRLTMRQCYV